MGQRPAAGHVLRPADGRGPRCRGSGAAGERRGARGLQGHRWRGGGRRLPRQAARARHRRQVRSAGRRFAAPGAVQLRLQGRLVLGLVVRPLGLDGDRRGARRAGRCRRVRADAGLGTTAQPVTRR
ncbi:hypothetical protein SGPA1_10680 [Streptomyces misionensis JCM 4497]